MLNPKPRKITRTLYLQMDKDLYNRLVEVAKVTESSITYTLEELLRYAIDRFKTAKREPHNG